MKVAGNMTQAFNELVQTLPPQVVSLLQPLHDIALQVDCRYRIDETATGHTIVYSAANYQIHLEGLAVSFEGDYDNRAFFKLYRETACKTVQALLFEAAEACCYCINDKCTTFLMAQQRTLKLDGRTKKVCAWNRHHLKINVTQETLVACVTIARMMFEYVYAYPIKHADLFYKNEVTYTLAEKDAFYVVGYVQRHSQISPSDEDFVASLLRTADDGMRKVDELLHAVGCADEGKYVGAIDNFINGVLYDFIFGVLTDQKPATLPEGAVCRKVRSGEWAVYNSSAGDYKSIWKHYTENFYAAEHKGFDRARIPFEYYDAKGQFYDVHIPVDADMPADSGRVITLQHMPNALLAGFSSYGETDHPLYRDDRPFVTQDKLRELFPLADKVVRGWVHALFGKPIQNFEAVIVDDYTPIPEGLERIELKGGYWRLAGRRHFNGGGEDWPFDVKLDSRVELNDCQHPRAFTAYEYRARGGYTEIGVPMRVKGKLCYEVVELPPQRVIGKLEAPPEAIVMDEEMQRLYRLPENKEPGSYVIGYTVVQRKSGIYFDKPLIKGVLAEADTPVPEGYAAFQLEGGTYVKVSEDVLNGGPGWELEMVLYDPIWGTEYKANLKGQFLVKQYDFGQRYDLYIPCE
jgi:predicted transcriptional regulator YdeE